MKMKIKTISTLLASMMLSSCIVTSQRGIIPSTEMTSYDIKATDIKSISTSASIAVIYTQTHTTSVKVECPENLKDLLDISMDGNCLEAGFKSNTSINGDCNVTVHVSSPELTEIDASSSSRVTIADGLTQTATLDIEASSSASVDIRNITVGSLGADASSAARICLIDLKADTIDAEASSAATIYLSGEGNTAEYEASSAATIDAGEYKVSHLTRAKASSAAGIRYSAQTVGKIKEESAGTVNNQ